MLARLHQCCRFGLHCVKNDGHDDSRHRLREQQVHDVAACFKHLINHFLDVRGGLEASHFGRYPPTAENTGLKNALACDAGLAL